jgi:DNA-binding CsgD family transcriptional regulator
MVFTPLGVAAVDTSRTRVSVARMLLERDSDSSPRKLNLRERAKLEYFAEGLSGHEISIRLRVSQREILVIRRNGAMKLAARIASANPFHIREFVIARSLDSVAL